MENELVFDLNKVAQYLAEKCGCTVEDADMYLIGEEEYLASIGLSGDGHEDETSLLTNEEAANTVVENQAIEDYVLFRSGGQCGLNTGMACADDRDIIFSSGKFFHGSILLTSSPESAPRSPAC